MGIFPFFLFSLCRAVCRGAKRKGGGMWIFLPFPFSLFPLLQLVRKRGRFVEEQFQRECASRDTHLLSFSFLFSFFSEVERGERGRGGIFSRWTHGPPLPPRDPLQWLAKFLLAVFFFPCENRVEIRGTPAMLPPFLSPSPETFGRSTGSAPFPFRGALFVVVSGIFFSSLSFLSAKGKPAVGWRRPPLSSPQIREYQVFFPLRGVSIDSPLPFFPLFSSSGERLQTSVEISFPPPSSFLPQKIAANPPTHENLDGKKEIFFL